MPRIACSLWLNLRFGRASTTRGGSAGGIAAGFGDGSTIPVQPTWQASQRAAPCPFGTALAGCARSILWQARQAASRGMRLSAAEVDVCAV